MFITGGFDTHAVMWDLATGRQIFPLRGHKFSVDDVGFSPDGEFAFTRSSDGAMRVWEARVALSLRGQNCQQDCRRPVPSTHHPCRTSG